MGGLTTAKLPYPTDGDLVQLVDESIQALAEAAGGVLGYANRTATQSGVTTEVDLTGLSVTVTCPAGHIVRISAQVRPDSTVAGDVARVSIKESTTVLQILDNRLGAATLGDTISGAVIITPTAGSHTYKLSLQRVVGTGSLISQASSTNPAFIMVEDLGPV